MKDLSALKASETRYRRLFETAQDGILILDAETGQIDDVNPFLIDMLGYTYKDFQGKKLWEIGEFKDIQASKEAFRELQDRGYVRYDDLPLETKKGRNIRVEFVSNTYQVNHHKVIQCNIRDITNRKHVDHEVREAHSYAEAMIDTVREPLLVLDEHLKVLSASRSFYDTFRVAPGETVGNFIYDLGNGQWSIPRLRKLLRDILKNTKLDNYEVDHLFPTIGHKFMRLNARRIYKENVGTKMILLAIEDVTDLKQRDEALKASETRYRRLFETAQDGILILDTETGQIDDVNPFLVDMLGYAYKDFLGKKLWELGAFKNIEASKVAFTKLQRKGYVRYDDLPLTTKDGREIRVEFVSNTYQVNHHKVIQCNIRDITNRKHVDHEVREAHSYAEAMIDTVREPLLVLDEHLKVLSASRSFYDTFRVAPGETVGNFIYDLGNGQWSIPRLRKLLRDILKNTKLDNYEVDHLFPTIGHKFMRLNARRIYKENVGTKMILLAIEDVTDLKQRDEALKASETRYRRLFETAQDGILILDTETGQIDDVN